MLVALISMSDVELLHPVGAGQGGPGVVWAFVFDEKGQGAPVSGLPDLAADRGKGFVWLHLDIVDSETRRWLSGMERTLGASIDSFTSIDSHAHVDWAGDLVWGVVHDICREVDGAGEQSADIRFAVSSHVFVTARRKPMQSAHALKRKVETGAAYESSADLLEALLTEIAEAIGRVSNRTSEQLIEIEDRVLTEKVQDERALLLKLRREVARYTRLAASLRAVVARLDQTGGAGIPQHSHDLTARLAQRVASLHSDIHYLADHARLLNEEVGAQVAAAANRHLFTLTILTTLLLPPSLVTGYFGMNTKNLPFTDNEYGSLYASAIVVGAALCVFLLMRFNGMLGGRR